jgi:creatinine amidohydrolase/Fe(II)-dependent formamide hydrolase-like protein
MKHYGKKALSLILSVLMLASMLMSAMWVSAAANTTTLIGFNEDGALGQVSLDGMGNGTLSVVDYDGGKALQYANGTWGYPTKATAEKGERILEHATETIVKEFNRAFGFMSKKEKLGYSYF